MAVKKVIGRAVKRPKNRAISRAVGDIKAVNRVIDKSIYKVINKNIKKVINKNINNIDNVIAANKVINKGIN